MQELIKQFLDYISVERGLAPNTIQSYGRDLFKFAEFLQKRGVVSIEKVSHKDIAEFMWSRKETGLAANSILRALVAIRVFYRFILREQKISHDPTSVLDSPRIWKNIPDAISVNEVEQLITRPDIKNLLGIRDRAILELLYATGMRVSEIVNLDLNDLNQDIDFVRCTGKGQKERIIPFGKKAKAAVGLYLEKVRNRLAQARSSDNGLFLTRLGRKMTRQMLWKLIKKYAFRNGRGHLQNR